MKHPIRKFETADLIDRYLDLDKVEFYLNEVEEANQRFNLFSRGISRRDLLILVAESMIPVEIGWINADSGRILDIGSGWGVPAIPLLLDNPGLSVILLERSFKKAGFLSLVLNRLEIKAEVVNSNLDDFDPEDLFALILSRGVGIDKKILSKLRTMTSETANWIFFGSDNFQQHFSDMETVYYSIDNLPARSLSRAKISLKK